MQCDAVIPHYRSKTEDPENRDIQKSTNIQPNQKKCVRSPKPPSGLFHYPYHVPPHYLILASSSNSFSLFFLYLLSLHLYQMTQIINIISVNGIVMTQ